MEVTNTQFNASKELLFSTLFVDALRNNEAIAIWRKPGADKIEAITDKDQGDFKGQLKDLDSFPSGFMIHPFISSQLHPPLYIKATNYFSIGLKGESASVSISRDLPDLGETAISKLSFEIRKLITKSQGKAAVTSTKKSNFIATVNKAVDAINSGDLYKVVPAKTKRIELPRDFDLASVFLSLCETYPSDFVNCFYSEKTGLWIGASPETLIRTKGNEFFTMALAGTQKAKGENPIKNAAWTQKEIEEQALVSRYIVDCFKKIRLREYSEVGPKTTVAGGLLHLKSEFLVDMKNTNFPQLGSVMLELLHPTSAICGMPKEKALAFLQSEEPFDREYFSGFIGPVNMNEETSLYVNLRCAKIGNNETLLFAGAGITEDSIPEKEWEETEMKCNIIGQFIQTEK